MTVHDHFAAHESIHRYWYNYDERYLDVLAGFLTDDCHLSSRTDPGQHPFEEFIRSDNRGRDAAMAWTKDHRRHSPYPLRHNATNIHVVAERGDEIDLESYLFVAQIVERKPSALSSGIVHWTLKLTGDGYRVNRKDVVLDSIDSAEYSSVDFVTERQDSW
jgi:hypothetical protein